MTVYIGSIIVGLLLAFLALKMKQSMFSFAAQKPEDYADEGASFDIREQLNGPMVCEGVIYGPTGRVNTRFVADMNAKWDGNTGHMTESFKYDNGGSLDREWFLKVGENGEFEATAPDIIGKGQGNQSGSGVRLNYNLKLPETAGGHVLNTVDWMYLMENGSIINRSQMRKFGITVGELVATMRKAA